MILQQRLKLLVDFKIFLWYNVGKLKRKDQAQFLPCLKAEVSLREMMKKVTMGKVLRLAVLLVMFCLIALSFSSTQATAEFAKKCLYVIAVCQFVYLDNLAVTRKVKIDELEAKIDKLEGNK